MIRIKITKGSWAGREWAVAEGTNPINFLHEILEEGRTWEIDYRYASPDESFQWGRADLVMRMVLALQEGRSVFFLGKEYRGLQTVGLLENAIVTSGRMITLGFDDERGLQILAPDRE